jgi:hypothetical protein
MIKESHNCYDKIFLNKKTKREDTYTFNKDQILDLQSLKKRFSTELPNINNDKYSSMIIETSKSSSFIYQDLYKDQISVKYF